MRDEVAYRGPDDHGSAFLGRCGTGWREVRPEDSAWTIALGHRRLSILDLSPSGHQPMAYRGKFWTVYNGEVYNFIELRAELRRHGHVFHSASDTEVILAAYSEWGPDCFARFRGMWGLVIVDCQRNEVIVGRDRLGIKPVYLWRREGIVGIASEIKQFRHLPGFTPRVDHATAGEFLRTGYEDPARSFFGDVQPVRPGTWLSISLHTLRPSTPTEYWHPERVQVTVTDPDEAGRLFAAKARESVEIHLRSDVPVGCALSGGLDSSAIVVLIDSLCNGGDPLHTFTATFPGETADERHYADAVLEQIRANPHFVTPSPRTLLEDLDRLLWVHDEPIGGMSMYAGYCVSRLTREAGVPVTLNGQGGDEILSGYWQSYFLHLRHLWKYRRFGTLAGHLGGACVGGNPALIGQIPFILRRYFERRNPSLRVELNHESETPRSVLNEVLSLDEQTRRVYEIRTLHLPRLLKWDDRNSMAFSVEGRYPFLDHELIELCLSFAPEALYRSGWTKLPLRTGLRELLPAKVTQRRSKFGFTTPQDRWLCGALRPELERWLGRDRPVWDFVDRKEVRALALRTWRVNGKHEEPGSALFRVFVFDRWLDLFALS